MYKDVDATTLRNEDELAKTRLRLAYQDTSPSSVEPPSLPRFSDGRPGGLVG